MECLHKPLEIENGNPVASNPGELENGRYRFGAKVTYVCNEGYHLVNESTRVCQLSGTWNGTRPDCESEHMF